MRGGTSTERSYLLLLPDGDPEVLPLGAGKEQLLELLKQGSKRYPPPPRLP